MKLVGPESDYYGEAVERFRELCEGRKLVGNVDYREGSVLHLRLMDPGRAGDALECINVDLVREGLGSVDEEGCGYVGVYAEMRRRLREAAGVARGERAGMYEFGDVE